MLIANIPVLANTHAARSYYNRNGVIEFGKLKDLAGALKQAEKWNGKIPVSLAPDTSGLIAGIKKALMNNQ
jgi:dsDNA-specific endonuclease/ATPase MutS2